MFCDTVYWYAVSPKGNAGRATRLAINGAHLTLFAELSGDGKIQMTMLMRRLRRSTTRLRLLRWLGMTAFC